MKTYAIYAEPGSAAHERRRRNEGIYGIPLSLPRPKRVGQVDAVDEWAALVAYVEGRYVGNRQYRGWRLEWSGSWASGATWRADDGKRNGKGSRRWRITVALANGAYEHDLHLTAQPVR